MRGKTTKTEKILLLCAAAYLCLLGALYFRAPVSGTAVSAQVAASSSEVVPAPVLVDINTADADALAELPGIGDTLARRIVKYREAHGPFEHAEDIQNVKGIGAGRFAAISGEITTGEELK